MTGSQQEALEQVRRLAVPTTIRLVEQGMGGDVRAASGDVDFWTVTSNRPAVAGQLEALGATMISRQDHAAWANHDVFVFSCTDGPLIIDVKYGDLRVGALTLMSEPELLASFDDLQRFSGYARVVDLLVRRMARGKPVEPDRLAAAQSAWQDLSPEQQAAARRELDRRVGAESAAGVTDLLEGREPALDVARSLRMQALGSSFGRASALRLAASKAFSNMVGWLTRRPRPFGRYPAGVLVVVSGTDGTGKSTTLDNVSQAVHSSGLRCREYYLGRGRGNLPGVGLLRDLVSRRVQNRHDTDDVYRSPAANTLASWVYCFEYFLRTLGPRFRVRVLGDVVLCDRYCYDIALIPGGSHRAARVARFLCPRPDINVLLHAPPDVLIERKRERSGDEIERHQEQLRRVIDNGYARHLSLPIDTSRTSIDETQQRIVAGILGVAHGGLG